MKSWPVVLFLSIGALAAPGIVTVGGGKAPSLAVDGEERTHLVYQGLQSGDNIYYRQSTDGGSSWGDEINVSNTPDKSHFPTVAAQGNQVAVAWLEDCRDHSGNDVYVAISNDAGHTFSSAVDVSHTPGHSSHPVVAVSNGSVHLAWTDSSDDQGGQGQDVFYSRSDNGGKSWTRAFDVSRDRGVHGAPSMAVGRGGLVHIAWADRCRGAKVPDIHVVRGMQDTWSPQHDISPTSEISSHPSLSLRPDGRACVAWLEDCDTHRGNDIYFASEDANGNWSRPVDVSHTPGVSSDPNLTIGAEGRAYVTWVDTTSGRSHPDVWQSRTDNGRQFSKSHNLSKTPGKSHEPHAAALSGGSVIAWEEVAGGRSWIKVLPGRIKTQ